MLSKPLFWLVKSHYSIILYLKSLVNLPCSLMIFSEIIIYLGEIHQFSRIFLAELPIFLGAKLPDLGPRGGSVAGHPQRSRRGRLLRGATLAAAAAAARGRGRDRLTNEKNGVYSTRDSHDIPTLHGKLVYFIKIFPCKYHGPFYRYFP